MGQTQSQGSLSLEELSFRLTDAFARKCLTPLELYIFKAVFKAHATTSSGVAHWSQATLARYLQLPEHPGLPIAHVIFQLASYIGAFPFPSQAPAILTNEALLRVVVVMTGRHTKVLRGGRATWEREIWRSLAVIDRDLETHDREQQKTEAEQGHGAEVQGFKIDQAQEDDEEGDDEDDELMLAAFDAMDATEAFSHGERQSIRRAMVPTDNFLTMIMFLLLIAPLGAQEAVKTYTAGLDDDKLQDLRSRAYAILTSFGVERNPGISYNIYRRVVRLTLPNLFDPLKMLFERFLYPPDFDLSKKAMHLKLAEAEAEETDQQKPKQSISSRPVLPDPNGELITQATLSQLSFVLPPSTLFRNLTLLYAGAEDGFSMPTFEQSVFNWQSPTLLIVSGTLISDTNASATARSFTSSLPYRRYKSSAAPSQTVTYAAYIPVPWKKTYKSAFGTDQTTLLQLSSQHDVFSTTRQGNSFVYFNRSPSTYTGIGFGSPLAEASQSSAVGLVRRNSIQDEKVPLGPVSLHLDDSLTYAVFTHDSRGGGTFSPSHLPPSCRLAPPPNSPSSDAGTATVASLTSAVTSPPTSPLFRTMSPSRNGPITAPLRDWQDVFEIDALEVYGLGGAEVAENQKRAQQWEEREAERRRGVQLRTGDVEADRELLKLAGLIGENRSGGSMG